MSINLNDLILSLDQWLTQKLVELSSNLPKETMVPFVKQSVHDMKEQHDSYEEIRR